MKKFMAVYIGTASALEKYQRNTPDPDKRKAQGKAGMEAWMKWGSTHAKSIVDTGAPLGKTKRISADGVSDIKNNLRGIRSCRRNRMRPLPGCSRITRTS
jgi:hypothetical protein